MSLLQKAIRRGDDLQALRAGFYLLSIDYRSLWRRLVVIAWEDISFGDFDLCGMITAASGSKRWRTKYGGEWRVASFLISALCKSQKNRVSDDLLVVVEHEASLAEIRDRLGTAHLTELRSTAFNPKADIYHRAIAAWYLLGTDKYGSDVLYRRSGDVDRYFSDYNQYEPIEHVLAVCRVAVSRSGTILPAMIVLLWNDWRQPKQHTQAISDHIEPQALIRGCLLYTSPSPRDRG